MKFFKNYKKTIIVLGFIAIFILSIFILSIFILSIKNQNQQNLIFNKEQFLNNNKQETTMSSRTKRAIEPPKPETPKPKIQINYDKIKSYILSKNENEVLSLNNLSQEEITEIEKARNSQKQTLKILKEEKNKYDEKQKKCNELIIQRDSVLNQIPPLQKQLQQKEAELGDKNKEIDKLKLERQTKQTQLQTQEISIYKNNELTLINDEINKLQDERNELIKQIVPIKLQIEKLESAREKYESMLSRAKDFQKLLEKQYKDYDKAQKYHILSELNSLYDITSVEE
ncbi:hypothetical protein [Candidatus Phytoplasma fraxini]|uniref:Uncharacterized protein n=1 Tax=Ash yellows phytoplasma TaxID=35780 RepID=A0ABZ2U8G4_ASHYP